MIKISLEMDKYDIRHIKPSHSNVEKPQNWKSLLKKKKKKHITESYTSIECKFHLYHTNKSR